MNSGLEFDRDQMNRDQMNRMVLYGPHDMHHMI